MYLRVPCASALEVVWISKPKYNLELGCMNINLISNKYVKTVIPSILTNFTAADAHRVTSAPTVNRQSTDSQTQRHYTLTPRLTRLAALFLMLLTLGVGQMWAWWYAPGSFFSAINFNTDCSQMSSENYVTYYCVPPGTYEFKLVVD